MWIQIVENDNNKHLINLDKAYAIVKDDVGGEPGIMINWEDGISDHYNISYDDVAERMSSARVLKW